MAESCCVVNLEFIKPQNLGSLLMKSRQSNFNLRSPGSHLVRSYLITTVFGSNERALVVRCSLAVHLIPSWLVWAEIALYGASCSAKMALNQFNKADNRSSEYLLFSNQAGWVLKSNTFD